jgi:hypothetical protein
VGCFLVVSACCFVVAGLFALFALVSPFASARHSRESGKRLITAEGWSSSDFCSSLLQRTSVREKDARFRENDEQGQRRQHSNNKQQQQTATATKSISRPRSNHFG